MNFDLYYAALAADRLYQAALVRQYGQSNAGTYRYWYEWKHPEEIQVAGKAYQEASEAWHNYVIQFRRNQVAA